MTRNPQVAAGWWTVQAFADDLRATRLRDPAAARPRLFPVVDLQGRATGVVRLEDLMRIAPGERRNVPVRQVARPCAAEQVVPADEPLERVAARPTPLSAGLLLAEEGGRLVGVLTPGDLTATAALHALHSGPSGTPGPGAGEPAAPGPWLDGNATGAAGLVERRDAWR
jgi:hypothetical protein